MSAASPRIARRLGVALALFGCLALAACARRESLPRHLILVTVDTLRADHLTPYGYSRDTSPHLARLAEDGVLFERAQAQWPKTGVSFASLFSGLYPHTTGLTHQSAIEIPDDYLTLPELLSRQGFTTVAVVSNGVLGHRLGWDRGFDEYLETWKLAPESSADPLEYRRWLAAPVVNQLAEPLLERHRDAERLFAWIHYSDPHAPYYLPDGEENPFLGDPWYQGDEEAEVDASRATAIGERRDLKFYVAQYDANVRLTDRYFGRLLDTAASVGLLDDSMVVFTADHGESLGEHGYYFGHGRLPYQPGSHVPLVVSYPDGFRRGTRVAAPVELVDLYPTLLEILAPEVPVPGLEGQSLAPWLRPGPEPDVAERERARYAFSAAGGGAPLTHFRSVQDERWKLVYHPRLPLGKGESRPPTYELYDLESDPGETRDLSSLEEAELRRLRTELKSWMAGREWIRLSKEDLASLHQETLDALKALGYLE